MTTANIDKTIALEAALSVMRSAQVDIDCLQRSEDKDERKAAYARRERAEEIAVLCEKTVDGHITMNGRDCLWLLG
jgi:hypothetical protein